ncbi:acyltransferase family protein [Ornithinicoccus hortensis]|uniref:Peptidoglycan/LPS O-acetylase OafA/YrhL n=1 Tax=Ornithinicoccus hortensis TaxID=82346 RepID=A0A542YP57_9MICO|nr:acyltransferase family protein [Ornithinicoccus hortensis]TQL49893.1 peptidoglycan/LPS O-acetylase OafA/YrhL [Ornithinicoccus hortensis]
MSTDLSARPSTSQPARADRPLAPIVTPAVPGSVRFRPEIEGLRTVAALLVAVYHVWLGRVSGGVDVFFVIAGFMMVLTILGHYERQGYLHLGRYLSRLASRLLPQALVVLVVVATATVLLLPATLWRSVFSDIGASALYYENWQLIERSVDYLQRDGAVSPVQHFWAMSIQGQFYLVLAALAVLAFATRGRRALDIWFGWVLGAAFLASFTYSVVLTRLDQPIAYFHTGTRLWEFAAGGLVALVLRRMTAPSGVLSVALGWVGLVLIVSCGVALSVSEAFPGWVALWPVLGAVFILATGNSGQRWSAAGLLSRRPMVRLGRISYGIYLWHWPVFVFYLHWRDVIAVGVVEGAVLIAASVGLAELSTRLVEQPVRSFALPRSSWMVLGASAALVALVAGAALAGANRGVQRTVASGVVGAPLVDQTDGTDLSLGNTDDPVPGVLAASDDVPSVAKDNCQTSLHESGVVECDYGDVDAERTVVLIGGSHSAHWLPGLDLAAQAEGWRVHTLLKNGCRVGYQLPEGEDHPSLTTCATWNQDALPLLVELDPDLVLMTSTVTHHEDPEEVPEMYLPVWQELADHDIPVLAIRDNPRSPFNRVDCMAEHGALSAECTIARESTLAAVDPTTQLDPAPANLTFADLSTYFCDDTECPAVIGNVVVYSDDDHITVSYSQSLADVLAQELSAFSGAR